jgi:hypothetical protein
MHLSAFGVESDNIPAIDEIIDFELDSSPCKKSFYNPAYKPSSYHLSPAEMKQVQKLLHGADFRKLQRKFTANESDQPTSTKIIVRSTNNLEIKDYSLGRDCPLKQLYALVYKPCSFHEGC